MSAERAVSRSTVSMRQPPASALFGRLGAAFLRQATSPLLGLRFREP